MIANWLLWSEFLLPAT